MTFSITTLNTQHDDTKHNDMQFNDNGRMTHNLTTLHDNTKHDDIQFNDNSLMTPGACIIKICYGRNLRFL